MIVSGMKHHDSWDPELTRISGSGKKRTGTGRHNALKKRL